jgi:protein required for attachment to host cells
MNDDRILVAVFDAGHARFFEYKSAHGHLVPVLEDVSSGLHHDKRDIEADKPGRTIGAGGEHHSFEAKHDPRKLEKHDFVRAIALALDDTLEKHAFGKLVVVAPPRAVGEFRSLASDKLKKAIWREVPKEFANMPDAELAKHLVPILQAPES